MKGLVRAQKKCGKFLAAPVLELPLSLQPPATSIFDMRTVGITAPGSLL